MLKKKKFDVAEEIREGLFHFRRTVPMPVALDEYRNVELTNVVNDLTLVASERFGCYFIVSPANMMILGFALAPELMIIAGLFLMTMTIGSQFSNGPLQLGPLGWFPCHIATPVYAWVRELPVDGHVKAGFDKWPFRSNVPHVGEVEFLNFISIWTRCISNSADKTWKRFSIPGPVTNMLKVSLQASFPAQCIHRAMAAYGLLHLEHWPATPQEIVEAIRLPPNSHIPRTEVVSVFASEHLLAEVCSYVVVQINPDFVWQYWNVADGTVLGADQQLVTVVTITTTKAQLAHLAERKLSDLRSQEFLPRRMVALSTHACPHAPETRITLQRHSRRMAITSFAGNAVKNVSVVVQGRLFSEHFHRSLKGVVTVNPETLSPWVSIPFHALLATFLGLAGNLLTCAASTTVVLGYTFEQALASFVSDWPNISGVTVSAWKQLARGLAMNIGPSTYSPSLPYLKVFDGYAARVFATDATAQAWLLSKLAPLAPPVVHRGVLAIQESQRLSLTYGELSAGLERGAKLAIADAPRAPRARLEAPKASRALAITYPSKSPGGGVPPGTQQHSPAPTLPPLVDQGLGFGVM